MIEIINKENNFDSLEIWSANKSNLVFGYIFLFMSFILEKLLINIIEENNSIIILLFVILFHSFVIITAYFSILYFKIYHRRKKFKVLRAKMEDGVLIDYIKDNFHIIDFNLDFVLFVNKSDEKFYNDWLYCYDFLDWNNKEE